MRLWKWPGTTERTARQVGPSVERRRPYVTTFGYSSAGRRCCLFGRRLLSQERLPAGSAGGCQWRVTVLPDTGALRRRCSGRTGDGDTGIHHHDARVRRGARLWLWRGFRLQLTAWIRCGPRIYRCAGVSSSARSARVSSTGISARPLNWTLLALAAAFGAGLPTPPLGDRRSPSA